MTESRIQTRADDQDDPEVESRIEAARRQGRKRTIFYAALVAGFVALFFGWQNDKDQVDRSRDNCELIQEDRKDRAKSVEESADRLTDEANQVLGHPGDPNADPPEPAVKPFVFKGTAFEEFEALIKKGALENRTEAVNNYNRAKEIRKRVENCEEVFPEPDLWPF